ncbi:MAG: response regulator [Moraxellaceae bacterium]|nr:response regulator [Moraxellaceae bacterium]
MVQRVLQHKHLLIAEDNAVNQMVIVGMLKRLGISAEIANHGKEALALYQKNPHYYHLVLMDCEMRDGRLSNHPTHTRLGASAKLSTCYYCGLNGSCHGVTNNVV